MIPPNRLEDPVIPGVEAIRLSLVVLIAEEEAIVVRRSELALKVCGKCDQKNMNI